LGGAGVRLGELLRPNGILVLDDSLLLVVERDNRRVQGFRLPSFEPLGAFGEDVLRRPYGLTAFPEARGYRVYLTDNYETLAGTTPPLAALGDRVKWFRVTVEGGRLHGVFGGSFGDTTPAGAIQVTESILADPANDRLLIAEELEGGSHLKVYTLDGRFTGETVGRELFPEEAEGIALYACGDSAGYWIATDQGPAVNTFHLLDRGSLRHVAAFTAPATHTTDGIVLTQRAFGPFPAGAFYASHGDAAISALSWADIAAETGVRRDCTTE
jgi:3-phytase